jgi:gliding motility-associated-like protein
MNKVYIVCTILIFHLSSYCQDFFEFGCAPFIQNCVNTQFYNATGVGADMINPSGVQFNAFNYGKFVSNSNNLVLRGGELKTRKNFANASICEVKMYYTIYLTATPPPTPVFLELDLPLKEACAGANFPSGGPCTNDDQKWSKEDYSVDLTTLPAGNYTLDVYFEVIGNNSGASGCVTNYTVNNNGNRFKATFEIEELTITASGSVSFCQGDFVTLTANPGTNIVWNPMNVTTAAITTFESGSYNFTYSHNNCTNTSNSTVVTVHPYPPTPTISINGPSTICPGGSTTLVSSSTTGNLWTPNNETSNSINISSAGQYGLSVTINGCTRNASPITIGTSSGPAIAVNNTFYCEGQATTLRGSGASNFTWVVNGQTYQGNPVSVLINNPTTIDVIGTSNSCSSQISVDLLPTSSPVAQFDTLILQNDCAYELELRSLSIDVAANRWFVNNSLISNSPITNHTFTKDISDVFLVSENISGCKDTAFFQIFKPSSAGISFYVPNTITPNGDELNNSWEVVTRCYKDFHCQIFNRWGNLIYESFNSDVNWDAEFNGSIVEPGTYTYTIKTKNLNDEYEFYQGNINVIR